MKKFLFLAASAALVLSSCMKNEVVVNPDRQKAIEFDAYVGKAPVTKVENDDNDVEVSELASSGFTVTAISTTLTDKKDLAVSGNPLKAGDLYWPSDLDEDVQFYAYSTYANLTYGTDGNANIKISELTPDLLWAEKNVSYNDNQGAVALEFSHILSKIAISAKVAADVKGCTAEVTEVTISGFSDNAAVNLTTGNVNETTATTPLSFEKTGLTNTGITNSEATVLIPYTEGYYVAPSASDTPTRITISVTYSLKSTATDTPVVQTSKTKTGYVDVTLLKNTKYMININLTMDQKPIEFTVSATKEWDNEDKTHEVTVGSN